MRIEIQKALLEAGRVIVLAVVPVIILGLEDGVMDMRLIWVTGAIALLRFVDKLAHEVGKTNSDSKLIKGITRF